MNFFEFPGVKISALAAAVPDNEQNIMDYAPYYEQDEIKKFCDVTAVRKRYIGNGLGTTASDLCVAAAENIFKTFDVDRMSIDGIIFLTQTPDYPVPSTSCVIQYRLGLDNCGLVWDSNIGCTGFPFGIQMACANIISGCKKVLLLVGDAVQERTLNQHVVKDSLLFGDCGVAAIIEKADEDVTPIRVGVHTIGKGYKALITPYGGERHPLPYLFRDRGEKALFGCHVMDGADVFTFSIVDVPRAAKKFFHYFNRNVDNYDVVSIHQANKMIIDNVAKRINAPAEKIKNSLERYGNTRGGSTAINILDYVQQEKVCAGTKKILSLAFGIGLNIAIADFELDMGRCLPIIKAREAFDDGIDNYTYF